MPEYTDTKFDVEKATVLRGVVGSVALGTSVGSDDVDHMGVCIEPPKYVVGLDKFEQYIYRDQPEGVRSQPGDLDLTIFSLRKFCRLALNGNPSILILLYLPDEMYVSKKTFIGDALLKLRYCFVSQEAGKRFRGYLVSQRMKLTGEKTKAVNRPELVDKYGFDTKFAMHSLRLGYQGVEFLREGKLTLPMQNAKHLIDVREGRVSFKEVIDEIEYVEEKLEYSIETCGLVADWDTINKFLEIAYRVEWGWSKSRKRLDKLING